MRTTLWRSCSPRAVLGVLPRRLARLRHLDRLRLLPRGRSSRARKAGRLDERMKHYKVEAVSVAVFGGRTRPLDGGARISRTGRRSGRDAGDPLPGGLDQQARRGDGRPPQGRGGRARPRRGRQRVLEVLEAAGEPGAAGQKVTLERILSHTRRAHGPRIPGIRGGRAGADRPAGLRRRAARATRRPCASTSSPGTKYRYSGGGYTIAQLALTDVSGKPFPELLRELVLAPAGMTSSTYEQPLPPAKLDARGRGYRSDGTPDRRQTAHVSGDGGRGTLDDRRATSRDSRSRSSVPRPRRDRNACSRRRSARG